jgi:hypothetical protein
MAAEDGGAHTMDHYAAVKNECVTSTPVPRGRVFWFTAQTKHREINTTKSPFIEQRTITSIISILICTSVDIYMSMGKTTERYILLSLRVHLWRERRQKGKKVKVCPIKRHL